MHSGRVFAECHQRHSRREFLSFLRLVETQTPKNLDIHMVLDNYATHKTFEVVRCWHAIHVGIPTSFPPTVLGSTRWSVSLPRSPSRPSEGETS
jgi:hypothetical protein